MLTEQSKKSITSTKSCDDTCTLQTDQWVMAGLQVHKMRFTLTLSVRPEF